MNIKLFNSLIADFIASIYIIEQHELNRSKERPHLITLIFDVSTRISSYILKEKINLI